MDIKNLNIKPLEQHVGGLIGVQVEFEKEFRTNRYGEISLHLSSMEMVGFTGIFQTSMESVKVTTFSPITHIKKKNKPEERVLGFYSYIL